MHICVHTYIYIHMHTYMYIYINTHTDIYRISTYKTSSNAAYAVHIIEIRKSAPNVTHMDEKKKSSNVEPGDLKK